MDIRLKGLIETLQNLSDMPPVKRVEMARILVELSRVTVSAIGDAAVVEALDSMTYKQLAAELDVSEATINKAVTRNRQRVEQEIKRPVR
jgi:predicted DNA-binding protein (UPF0251 family)